MKQLEIEFFWPLTEQIPLDLDYTGCMSRTYTTTITSGGIGSTTDFSTLTLKGSDGQITTEYRLNAVTTKIILPEEPGFIRKWAYKILGLTWGVK